MRRIHQINLQTRFPQHRARGTAPVYQARSTSHTFYPPAADSTPDQLPAPLFTLPPSPFTSHSLFTLSCENAAAAIYYTLDGSTPTAESTLYTAPFAPYQVGSVTIRAIAILEGFLDSDITEETVTLIHPLSALDTLGSPIQPILHDDYYYLVFTQVGANSLAVHKATSIGYLLVGAGGGGGDGSPAGGGGGGGGGRVLSDSMAMPAGDLTISVGAGVQYQNGQDTVLIPGQIVAKGGGKGGNGRDQDGSPGGNGGGAGGRYVSGDRALIGGINLNDYPAGQGYGNDGGSTPSTILRTGAGGGGASSPGTAPTARSYASRGRGGSGITIADYAGIIEGNLSAIFSGGGDGGSDKAPYQGLSGEGSHGYGSGGGTPSSTQLPGGPGLAIIRWRSNA